MFTAVGIAPHGPRQAGQPDHQAESDGMQVLVEFYGIPWQRAGVHRAVVEHANEELRLADVLRSLAEQFPQFGDECLDAAGLRPTYIANINGERFVADPNAIVRDGDALLIMSADAGG